MPIFRPRGNAQRPKPIAILTTLPPDLHFQENAMSKEGVGTAKGASFKC